MSTIIRLREQEGNSQENGNYKVNLDKPIMIKNGDSLVIKSAFLDTISASGSVIELPTDVPITMDVCRYFINDNNDQAFTPGANVTTQRMRDYSPALPVGSTISTNGDGKKYYSCKVLSTDASTFEVESVPFRKKKHKGLHKIGGLDITFAYTRAGDETEQEYAVRIPRVSAVEFTTLVFKTKIFTKGDTFRLITDRDILSAHGINPDVAIKYKQLTPGGSNNINYAGLDTQKFSMTLPKGVYSPVELGEKITDEMVKLGVGLGNNLGSTPPLYPVESPFLSTICQDTTKAAAETPAKLSCYCSETGDQFIRYNQDALMRTNDQDRFIGANQVSLSYDPEHQKMSFPIIHFPFYVNESTHGNDALPGVDYQPTGLIKKYGGVAFTSLGPPDFWQLLGFEGVCVKPEVAAAALTTTNVAGFTSNVIPLVISSVEGINTTEAFESLDTPVQKSVAFRNPNPTGGVSTAATLPILGTKVFATDYSNEGYYYIELDCGLNQELIGSHGEDGLNSNKIHSIVGTYFQNNNYTSDTGVGSIAYTHKGDDQLISNFGVRILNCEGEVPPSNLIGNKNNVFLELIRGNQQ
tara:strand:+ start:762 stop:2507 length:1746 start_codon:yes stop_codon:yes gene_type:complete